MSAFDNGQETPDNKVDSSTNAFSDQLAAIKNESGEQKYDSVDTALDALKHSQSYIPELKNSLTAKEQEIEQLKTELAKRSAIEEVVEKLTANQAEQTSNPQASGLDEQAVLNLFENYSTQKEQQTVASKNEKLVSDTLVQVYGEKTQEVVAEKAKELGMTVDSLKQLAQSSPSAALQLFGTQKQPDTKTSTTSVNIGLSQPEDKGLEPPEKSLLYGASQKDQVEYLRKVREATYKKFDVQV